MTIEHHGKTYILQHFKSSNPAGQGMYVRDMKLDQTIFEIFRNEDEQKILFNSLEFHADLELVEKVIKIFDKEMGRKFEPEFNPISKNAGL